MRSGRLERMRAALRSGRPGRLRAALRSGRPRRMRAVLRGAGFAALLAVAIVVIVVGRRRPSLDRQWDADVAVLAGVTMATPPGADGAPRISFANLRDWSYSADTVLTRRYFDATYHPDDIVDVWMYEQQLDATGLIAHTFLVFEFPARYGDERFLGLSVETRRESDEEYSLVGGMLRAFEVTHIWATERDLVTRRVRYLGYPLTRYRLRIPEDIRARIFVKLARETEALAAAPRWYNTATNNCTSSLIRYVNESEPGAIPRHYSYVLTGRVDEYLADLGYLDRSTAERITRERLARGPLRS